MTDNIVRIFVLQMFLLVVSAQATERVSISTGGAESNGQSVTVVVSNDCRYVVFVSGADNLVTGDTNGVNDIFLRDTLTDSTIRVSTATDGSQAANGHSSGPAISSSGRYLVFVSGADNLVVNDTNNAKDVFLKDLQTGQLSRVSVGSSGSQANGASVEPVVSADGRYVSFQSVSDNLVSGDTNGVSDIFLKDVQTGQITRVSTNSSGVEAVGGSVSAAISSDGRYVAFQSAADNLVENDTNEDDDIFLKDLQTGQVTRVSTDSAGNQASSGGIVPAISGDARYVVFESNAGDLVAGDTNGAFDIFLKDTHSGMTWRVSTDSNSAQANGGNLRPVISFDGRYLAYDSLASNLVVGDTNGSKDILVKDMANSVTVRVSTDSSGIQGNNSSVFPEISGDGSCVVFASLATNLVATDTNNIFDVFYNTSPVYVSDTDGDRVRDDIELLVGSDPNSVDTDGDGVSDYDELNRDNDPYTFIPGADTDPADSDTDNDGFSDGLEIWANTDPLDAASVPERGDITGDGNVNLADILMAYGIIISGNVPTPLEMEVLDIAPLVNGIPAGNNSIDLGDLLFLYRKSQGVTDI